MSSQNAVRSSRLFTLSQTNRCTTKVIVCGMAVWLMNPLKPNMENIFIIAKEVSTFKNAKSMLVTRVCWHFLMLLIQKKFGYIDDSSNVWDLMWWWQTLINITLVDLVMLMADEYVTIIQKNVSYIYNVANNITVTDRSSIDISDQGPKEH